MSLRSKSDEKNIRWSSIARNGLRTRGNWIVQHRFIAIACSCAKKGRFVSRTTTSARRRRSRSLEIPSRNGETVRTLTKSCIQILRCKGTRPGAGPPKVRIKSESNLKSRRLAEFRFFCRGCCRAPCAWRTAHNLNFNACPTQLLWPRGSMRDVVARRSATNSCSLLYTREPCILPAPIVHTKAN